MAGNMVNFVLHSYNWRPLYPVCRSNGSSRYGVPFAISSSSVRQVKFVYTERQLRMYPTQT